MTVKPTMMKIRLENKAEQDSKTSSSVEVIASVTTQ